MDGCIMRSVSVRNFPKESIMWSKNFILSDSFTKEKTGTGKSPFWYWKMNKDVI